MAKFLRTIVAGPLVVQAVYPAPHPRDSLAVRQGKKNLTSAAQQRLNLRYAWQKLELELAANFVAGDLVVTLTYDDDHLPGGRQEAQTAAKGFWGKLRAARRRQSQELKYVYITEHKHGDGRWHHHCVINSTGDDYDLLQQIWGNGHVDIKPLRVDRDKTYESLARYFCKEQRDKVGQRLWSGSRNLAKPERDTQRVPNDTPLTPPPGVLLLDDTGDVRTAYGHYRYIKYLAGGYAADRAPRTRRRKRRKTE